jgi:bifunctional aspartokinase / homoserine dehydrogenase 1
MKKIVVKIGGSNLKSDEDPGRIVRIIKAYKHPVVIVVSAFYGVTNYLQELIWEVRHDQNSVKDGVDFILRKKEESLLKNVSAPEARKRILDKLDARVREMERYLLGIHYIGDIPRQTEELILSYGERFSSLILTEILKENGLDAVEKCPEDIHLRTCGNSGGAGVDYESSRVAQNISFDKITVIPGFYGISKENKVVLLGRGGSDYSAAAIARCIEADSLDIWKDVDGFMSGDPKIVKSPRNLEKLTYTEAAELAYFGAKILHPRTVEPLITSGIPIRIFDISTCKDTHHPRTIISSESRIHEDVIKSVTFSDDFGILQLEGPGVGMKAGILAVVTGALDDAGINIKSVITAQTSINILLSINDLEPASFVTKKVLPGVVSGLKLFDKLSLIAVVGQGILETPGVAARIFGAVSRRNINVRIISVGASPVAAYFIVEKTVRDEAVRTIHEEFFTLKKIEI